MKPSLWMLCLVFGGIAWLNPARRVYACNKGSFCGFLAPIGVNAGTAVNPSEGGGVLLGGQADFVYWTGCEPSPIAPRYPLGDSCGAVAYGGYADVVHDFRLRSWRVSVGAEYFPATLFGFDAGPVLERLPDSKLRGGLRVRLLVAPWFSSPSFGVLPHLGLVETFLGDTAFVVELGVLVKFPIPTGLR